MSITISNSVAQSHVNKIATVIGPNLFNERILTEFFVWFDELILSGKDDETKIQNARKILNVAPWDYAYRPVKLNPALFEDYTHKSDNDVPEAVRKVFDTLFSEDNYAKGGAEDKLYNKRELTDLLHSMISLVGDDVGTEESTLGWDPQIVDRKDVVRLFYPHLTHELLSLIGISTALQRELAIKPSGG